MITTRRRRRAALATALALVVAPLLVTSGANAAVCETGDSCVTIEYVSTKDGVTKTVAGPFTIVINQNPDLVAAPVDYKVRNKRDETPKSVKEGGIPNTLPLPKLLAQAEAEAGNDVQDDVTFSETPGVGKVPAVLAPERLDGSETYMGGLVPAVYAVTGGGVGYVRPVEDETTDVNASEVFTTAGTLKLTFHVTGDLLSVGINSSPKEITTTTPVSFSATVEPESDDLNYRWNFSGGSKVEAKTATPSYTFTKKGSYAVNLAIRGDDGSYGRAATKSVKVGKPPKAPSTGGTGGGGGGTGSGFGGGGSGYIPPSVPSSDLPTGEDAPTDELPTGPVDDGLQEVEGYVLAGVGASEGESIPGTDVAAQPTEADQLSTKRKISGVAIGTLAVLLLLGLGAEIETRWLSTRLGHMRRRA